MITIAICSHCYGRIHEDYGDEAIYLLIRVCQAYADESFLSFSWKENPVTCLCVKYLEYAQIVVSTELSKTQYAFVPSIDPTINRFGMPEYCWCAYE